MTKLVIDAGHGGKDTGVEGVLGTREKDLALIVVSEMKRIFYKYGIEVYQTRSGDVYLSEEERRCFAESLEADYFISIHFDNNSINNNCIYTNDIKGLEVCKIIQEYLERKCECCFEIKKNKPFKSNFTEEGPVELVIVNSSLSSESLERTFVPVKYGEIIAKACLNII